VTKYYATIMMHPDPDPRLKKTGLPPDGRVVADLEKRAVGRTGGHQAGRRSGREHPGHRGKDGPGPFQPGSSATTKTQCGPGLDEGQEIQLATQDPGLRPAQAAGGEAAGAVAAWMSSAGGGHPG